MKIITKLILVASMVLPGYSFSQEVIQSQKQVPCLDLNFLIQFLKKEFNESPVFIGADTNGKNKFFMSMNPKTGTWTIVEHNDKIGCVLGSGINSQINIEIIKNLGI